MRKIIDIEFYKDIYIHEINRKENLNSKLSTYIGLLTVLGGIVVFEIENLYQNNQVNPILQYVLIILITIILGINIYNLYKANHSNEYMYLDNARSLKREFDNFKEYYKIYYDYFKKDDETLECLIERKKEESLIDIYVRCSEVNSKINDERYEKNLKFIKYFIYSLIIVGMIGILCIIVKKPIDINILRR